MEWVKASARAGCLGKSGERGWEKEVGRKRLGERGKRLEGMNG
jgi:hypothetical protein